VQSGIPLCQGQDEMDSLYHKTLVYNIINAIKGKYCMSEVAALCRSGNIGPQVLPARTGALRNSRNFHERAASFRSSFGLGPADVAGGPARKGALVDAGHHEGHRGSHQGTNSRVNCRTEDSVCGP
jgi:hypothetical protein